MNPHLASLRGPAILLGFFALCLLLSIALSFLPTTVLLFGWWHFLARNLPQLTPGWGLLATGLICSVLAILVGNGLFRALFRQFQQAAHPGQAPGRWPWRWTLCLYCGLWLLFAIAFGAAGVLRHTTWLLTAHQSWYQPRREPYWEFRRVDTELQELLLDNPDLEGARKAFACRRGVGDRRTLLAEEFNVLFYGDHSNQVAAYLIIPCHPSLVARGQFAAAILGTNLVTRPLAELPRTIAEWENRYGAK